jgi:hypothetical protein
VQSIDHVRGESNVHLGNVQRKALHGWSSVRQDQTLGAIKHPLYPPGGTTSVLALAKHCLLLVGVAEGHLRLSSTSLIMGWRFRRNIVPKPGSYHQLPGLEKKSPLCPSYASLGLNAASTIRPSIKGM